MSFAKLYVVLNAVIALALGGWLLINPGVFTKITGDVLSTASAMIEIRAMYAGIFIALGLWIFTQGRGHMRSTIWLLIMLYAWIGLARTAGIIIDGSPNMHMKAFLGIEIMTVLLGFLALKTSGDTA